MITVNIHQAKKNLSTLVEAVFDGQQVIIAKAGKPTAKLIPIRQKKRKPGSLKNKIDIAPHFNAPLPSEIIKQFEGN